MAFVVEFNGFILSDYFRIRNVNRDILPPRDLNLLQVPNRDGSYYGGITHAHRIIEIDVALIATSPANYMTLMRRLAFVLDENEPAPLSFSDDVGKEYYAILSEETNMKQILNYGEGTLKFICPDPIAYAQTPKTITPTGRKYTFQNNGTTDAFPVFTTTFSKDASHVSITSPDGVILIGDPAHVDKVKVKKYQTILADNCMSLSGWVGYSAFDSYITANGIFRPDSGIDGFVPNTYGTGTGWIGAGMRKDLGTTLTNFQCEAYIQMSSQDGNSSLDGDQMGRIEVYGFNSSGGKIFKMSMRDSYTQYEFNTPEMYAGNSLFMEDEPKAPPGKKVKQRVKNKKGQWETITKTVYPEHVGKWNDFYGKLTVSRINDIWTMTCSRIVNGKITKTIKRTFNDKQKDIYPNSDLAYIAVYIGKHSTAPAMGKIGLTYLYVSKVNNNTTIEIPDIFSAGDVLEVNTATGAVYVNDNPAMGIVDVASTFFSIPPGTTEVKVNSDDPSAVFSASYQERFL